MQVEYIVCRCHLEYALKIITHFPLSTESLAIADHGKQSNQYYRLAPVGNCSRLTNLRQTSLSLSPPIHIDHWK